jgi:hypothetical protein
MRSACRTPCRDRDLKLLYRALAAYWLPHDRGALLALVQAATRAGAVPHELGRVLKASLDLPDLRLRNVMRWRARWAGSNRSLTSRWSRLSR